MSNELFNKELQGLMKDDKAIYILPFGGDMEDLPKDQRYQVLKRIYTDADVYKGLDSNDREAFFLRKKFLLNLASDCGIIFDADSLKGSYLQNDKDNVIFEVIANVKIKLPTGEMKSMSSQCVIDVCAELEAAKDELFKHLSYGIVKNGKTDAIISNYKGSWKKFKNMNNVEETRYFLNEDELSKFIRVKLKEKKVELKRYISSATQSKAKTKVIKEIANIESCYPIEQYGFPFVIIRPIKSLQGIRNDEALKNQQANTNQPPANTGQPPVNTGNQPISAGQPINNGQAPVNTGTPPVSAEQRVENWF